MTTKPTNVLLSQMNSDDITTLSVSLDLLSLALEFHDLSDANQVRLLQLRQLLINETQKRNLNVYPE